MRRRDAIVALALSCTLPAAAGAQHQNRHDARALREDPRLAPGQIAPVLEGLRPERWRDGPRRRPLLTHCGSKVA